MRFRFAANTFAANTFAVLVAGLCLLATPAHAATVAGATVAATTVPSGIQSCGTVVDIGFTVSDGIAVRGSGSYTSQSCRALDWVRLSLVRNGTILGETTVTRFPSEPSSASFSPRDHQCSVRGVLYSWRTFEEWRFADGGRDSRYSNTISVNCF